MYANGDSASALTLAEFAGERGDGLLVLGHYGWLEPLYALRLTRWLPHHRQVWEVMPTVVYGISVLLAGWTLLRASGRRAALAIVLLMAVPAPLVFGFVGAPNAHGHTLFHTLLLAAFLATVPRLSAWPRWGVAAWAVALAVSFSPGVASDVLILVGAGAAFLVAVAAGWWLGLVPRAMAIVAAGACVAGIALGQLLVALAEDDGVVATGKGFELAPADQIAPHLRMLLESLGLYAHGRYGGHLDFLGVVRELLALAVALAVVYVAVRCMGAIARRVRGSGLSATARLLVVFWTVVIAGTGAAYVLTTAPTDIFATRYTLPMWPALISLPLLLLGQRAIRAAYGLAAALAVMGCVGLSQGEYTGKGSPLAFGRDIEGLRQLVEREHLDHGYASYWDAATITAQSDFEVRAYPVEACGAQALDGRCPFNLHRIDSWYAPKPAPIRTFYLVNYAPLPAQAGPPPARWGKPAKVVTLGQIQVFIYDYDLAGRLLEGT